MAELPDSWWRQPELLQAEVERLGGLTFVAAHHGLNVSTVQKWWSRFVRTGQCKWPEWLGDPRGIGPRRRGGAVVEGKRPKIEKPGMRRDGNEATLVSMANPRGTDTLTPDELMRQHGLDPEHWVAHQVITNQWDVLTGDGGVSTMHQLKVICRRRVRVDLIVPARVDGWKPPKRRDLPPATSGTRLVVLFSDPHHPYIEQGLHAASCRWLADVKPDRGIDMGDGLDLPKPSRHKANPAFDASPQECVDGEYAAWRDRVAASPHTPWERLPGNHDQRIRDAQLERLGVLYGLRRAQVVEEIERDGEYLPQLDLAVLLRLDELGVQLVRADNDGDYHQAQVEIAKGLVGRHGTRTGGGGQTGASKAGARLVCSIAQGHDHKQGVNYETRWDEQGNAHDTAQVSVGTMARRALGYNDDPNVQQGFATVTVHDDGSWHIELARWHRGHLYWRGERW